MHQGNRGPLKGAVLAQRALQGSETETRELLVGTDEEKLTEFGHSHILESRVIAAWMDGFSSKGHIVYL